MLLFETVVNSQRIEASVKKIFGKIKEANKNPNRGVTGMPIFVMALVNLSEEEVETLNIECIGA